MIFAGLLVAAILVWIALHVSVSTLIVLMFFGSVAGRILNQSIHPRVRRRLAQRRTRRRW